MHHLVVICCNYSINVFVVTTMNNIIINTQPCKMSYILYSDNLPYTFYEKTFDGKVHDITDELPFEIPKSWEWVRLGNVCTIARGSSPRPIKDYITSIKNSINWIKISDADIGGKYIISAKEKIKLEGVAKSRIVHKGDFLLTNSMSFGRPYILNIDGCIHDGWLVLSDYKTTLDVDFFYHILSSPFYYYQFCGQVSGAVVKNLNSDKVANSLFPLPPLVEQHRIVERIEKLLPYISDYKIAEQKLTALNTLFPGTLKKSILQAAVQGKLVKQDPGDEPASTLLECISAEKEELIKDGKIKRNKHEAVIVRRDNSHYEKLDGIERCIDDEIPFDIPDSWAWIRMGSLVAVNPRNAVSDDTIIGFIPMPLLQDGFNNNHTFEEKLWKDVKSGFTHFSDNDVVIAKITPCFQNRKSAVIHDLPNGYGAGTTELHVLRDYTKTLYMPYFLLLCKTHAFIQDGMKNFSGTAGQQRVGKDFISNYLVPLPPVEEQKRIVRRTNFVLKSCNIL